MARGSDIVIAVIAILFPPAAVAMLTGCGCDLLINICLTLLGYIPGHIHAFWILWKKMKAEELYGVQGYQYLGNGEFVAVAGGPPQANHRAPPPPHYGSTR